MKTLADGRGVWILLATIVGSSLVFIDGSVVALALPEIQRTFGATAAAAQWIVELYTLALGALMLFGGALGDRAGRRRIFAIGVAIFAAASLACAFATSIPLLLGARFVQGIGGMLLAPASLAIIGAHFSGNARTRAIAAWSAFTALTSTIGPALGGVMIDHFGWRSIFFVNLPLALLVLYATWRHVDESQDDEHRGALDVVGAGLCTLGLGAITYALIESSAVGWFALRTGGALCVGIVAMAVFVVVERRSRNPLLPLELFASRAFLGINIATLLLYGALSASLYELPFVMIQAHGYSATQTAIATLPLVVGIVALSRFGATFSRIFGRRLVLTVGPAVVAVGFLLLGLLEPQSSYWTSFFAGMLLIGIGMGITVAPLTSTVLDAASARHMGAASGVNNAVSRVAGLLSIAALGAVLWVTFNGQLNARLDGARATAAQRLTVDGQRAQLGAARVPDHAMQAIVIESFRAGFRAVAYGCALLALLAAVTDALTLDKKIAASKASS
jgi:EmrB/QacA subfamily drug resistance transporter